MENIVDNLEELNFALDSYWCGNKSDSKVKKIWEIQRRSKRLIELYKSFNEVL